MAVILPSALNHMVPLTELELKFDAIAPLPDVGWIGSPGSVVDGPDAFGAARKLAAITSVAGSGSFEWACGVSITNPGESR